VQQAKKVRLQGRCRFVAAHQLAWLFQHGYRAVRGYTGVSARVLVRWYAQPPSVRLSAGLWLLLPLIWLPIFFLQRLWTQTICYYVGIWNAVYDGLCLAQSRLWVLRASSDTVPLPYSSVHPCGCLPACVGVWVSICVLCGWLFVVLLKSLSPPCTQRAGGGGKEGVIKCQADMQ